MRAFTQRLENFILNFKFFSKWFAHLFKLRLFISMRVYVCATFMKICIICYYFHVRVWPMLFLKTCATEYCRITWSETERGKKQQTSKWISQPQNCGLRWIVSAGEIPGRKKKNYCNINILISRKFLGFYPIKFRL